MAIFNTEAILADGAVLTKAGAIVSLEPEGDCGLFFMSQVSGTLDTDRAEFDSKQQRDEALLNTVNLYRAEGWALLVGEES